MILALLGAAILAFVIPAQGRAASWETIQTFAGGTGEDAQLGGVSGMAVNETGAGGVEPGTVYTIGVNATTPWHAARYSPAGTFQLAWSKTEHCGPAATPPSACPPAPEGSENQIDIAVDQTTGNVYVYYEGETPGVVRIYKPDGTGPIAEFGEMDRAGTSASSPEKLHGTSGRANIAVNAAGEVYVYDEDTSTDFHHRLAVFKPCVAGVYTNYCYAGVGRDIGSGSLGSNPPFRPMVDDAGNVYVAGETFIQEYKPTQPSAPVCTFNLPGGGIASAAVNPETGGVFYYTAKPERVVHQLNPCSNGTFTENKSLNPAFPPLPQRGNIQAMAMDPGAHIEPAERAAGVLYAGTPEPCPPGVSNCPVQGSLGYIFAPQLHLEPSVEAESVTTVGRTSAVLNASINPKGPQTRYAFQYVTEATYQANNPAERFAGSLEAPIGGAELGSGKQPLLAAVTIAGLAPGTAYRYRAVATNEDGTSVGVDETFRTFSSGDEGLPDGRAYELVSPAQKNGGEVLPAAPNIASCGGECKPGLAATRFAVQAAPTGAAIAYQGQPFSLNEGPVEYDEYVSTRSSSGWQTESLGPPLVGGASGLQFEAFSLDPELTRAVTYATNAALTPGAPLGYRNLFNESVGNRFGLEPLLRATPPNRLPDGASAFQLNYAGASTDLSRVFFEANDALTGATSVAPAAAAGGPSEFNLYEWNAGQLRLVNVQPGNAATNPGAAFGSGFALADKSQRVANFTNAVSSDGSRVFWSSAGGQVYVRENAERTLEIPDHTGKFLSASTDGSKVLLSDGTLYNLETGISTDLTAGLGGFQGLVGQGDNLDAIYFIDTSVLTKVANDQGAVAQATQDNLYGWRNGAISFVGALLPGDNSGLSVWHASAVQRAAEASPDGRWLAFNSKAALTDSNTIGACEFKPLLQKFVGSVPCEEVYLFDSATGSLICASCNSTDAPPLGGSFLRTFTRAAGYLQQPRYLTNEGRLYFDSRDALSFEDTNNGVEDVYQYEQNGFGSCHAAGGCVALLSGGNGRYDSNFLATDPTGNNVFFTTRQRLVPLDQDSLIDLYDARSGGGLAADYAPPSVECSGEGCQPSSSPSASEITPSSESVPGTGNAKPKKPHHKKHKKKKTHHSRNKQGKGAQHSRRLK